MVNISKPQLAVYIAAAVAIVLIGARYLSDTRSQPGASSQPQKSEVQVSEHNRGSNATVHVVGAVKHPGVYQLEASSRVKDAVKRAGGATAKADLAGINLAAKLEDGRQVIVPQRQTSNSDAASSGVTEGSETTSQKVNLNTANLEELQQLDGVGPTIAEKILKYRQEHGGFSSVKDLDEIDGVGEKRIESWQDQINM